MQICDSICEKILSGEYPQGERIPSVRELGAEIGVNPNTIMRSYERLTAQQVIFNRRGIGYFISHEAVRIILETNKTDFIENELPQIIHKMKLLGITLDDLKSCW